MTRFLLHAARVRIIRCSLVIGCRYHEQLALIVLERNGGRGIFTKLHTMKCDVNTLDQASILSFSTTALTTIDISPAKSSYNAPSGELVELNSETPKGIIQTLEEILRVSPNITSFAFNVPLDEDSIRALLQFPRLKTVRQVQITSPIILTALLNDRRLVSLDLKCSALMFESPWSKQLPYTFRTEHLVELSLGGQCATLTTLFSTLRAPVLRRSHLTLRCGRGSHEEVWTSEVAAIYAACMRAFVVTAPGLEELHLTLLVCWYVTLDEVLAPILPLRTIRRFTYDDGALHIGSDADFAAIAQAWGRSLEALRFERRGSFWHYSGPVPSAIALSSLRASCPRLTTLVLPSLDPNLEKLAQAEGRDTDEHVHPLSTLSIRLWEMESKDISINVRERWEAYLMRLFPKLVAGEGNEALLVGEFPDEPAICGNMLRRRAPDESQSSDDEAPARDSTPGYPPVIKLRTPVPPSPRRHPKA